MGDIVETAQFVLKHVSCPVAYISAAGKAVVREAACPHYLRAKHIIVGLGKKRRSCLPYNA